MGADSHTQHSYGLAAQQHKTTACPLPPPISQPVSCASPHSSASLWHKDCTMVVGWTGRAVAQDHFTFSHQSSLPSADTTRWKELAEHHLEDLIGNQCSTESSCLDYPQGNPHTTLTLHPSHNSGIEETPHTSTTFCWAHSDTVEQVATYCTQFMFDAI